uniref:Uncharacterized protein n=1 Tax=Oryzias latipes TaxID=8090 RepID=A0A3B3HCV2_ORYLA
MCRFLNTNDYISNLYLKMSCFFTDCTGIFCKRCSQKVNIFYTTNHQTNVCLRFRSHVSCFLNINKLFFSCYCCSWKNNLITCSTNGKRSSTCTKSTWKRKPKVGKDHEF